MRLGTNKTCIIVVAIFGRLFSSSSPVTVFYVSHVSACVRVRCTSKCVKRANERMKRTTRGALFSAANESKRIRNVNYFIEFCVGCMRDKYLYFTNTHARSTLMRANQQQMQWINSLNTKNDHMMEYCLSFYFSIFKLLFVLQYLNCISIFLRILLVLLPLLLLVLRRNTIMDSCWRRNVWRVTDVLATSVRLGTRTTKSGVR